MLSLRVSTIRQFVQNIFLPEARKIVTTPALRRAPNKQRISKIFSSILPPKSGSKTIRNIRTHRTILGNIIDIKSGRYIEQSSLKQVECCPGIAEIIYYVNRKLLPVTDIVLPSDKLFREVAPTLVRMLVMYMYCEAQETADTERIAQFSPATPVIVWTLFRSRKHIVRIAANVMKVIAMYGLHRYKSLQCSESKAVNSSLYQQSTADCTDNQLSDEDAQIQLVDSENVLSREEITGFITLVLYIGTASVLSSSVAGKIIAKHITKCQKKKLVEDVQNFLSERKQLEITSRIKSDLVYIKNSISKCTKEHHSENYLGQSVKTVFYMIRTGKYKKNS